MPVSAAMAAEQAQLQLSNLTAVALTEIGLTAAAVFRLATADWPVLKYLYLGHNYLVAAAMQHLCEMHLPALKVLQLPCANITVEGAHLLAQGSWPLRTNMDPSHYQLDAQPWAVEPGQICSLFWWPETRFVVKDCSN